MSAHAQVAAPLAVRAHDNPRASSDSPQSRALRSSPLELPSRLVLGLSGAYAGLIGGSLFGANVLYRGGCACEDPGLGEALVGAAIGSVIVSGIVAALPAFTSTCGPGERIERGIGDSLVRALTGAVVGSAMGGPGGLYGYIGGAGIGAGLASVGC